MKKIHKILNATAEKWLWDGTEVNWEKPGFSCYAVLCAKADFQAKHDAVAFLETLGVDKNSSTQFDEFSGGPERQAARYMWLKFAAMYAKELGL